MIPVLLGIFLASQAQAADLVIPKTQFVDGMKVGLPESLCTDQGYFRKCFNASKADCEKEVRAAAASCSATLEKDMPAQFHQPADGKVWGEKLGNCTGGKYEADLGKNRLQSADCNDAAKWKTP